MEVAQELRSSTDLAGLAVHGFLVNLALLWNLVFFSVEDLTLLVSGLAQLLELSISEMFGDFHTTDDQF